MKADFSAPSSSSSTAEVSAVDSPLRIAELAEELAQNMANAVKQIKDVNGRTRLLSFNAQIEAARAGGTTGAAFGVVAQSIQQLSGQTAAVAEGLTCETQASIAELTRISQSLSSEVQGERLVGLAHTAIDLIDRNLFERTCDVRWWATDSSLFQALKNPTEDSLLHASERMGVILSAYTVYHDLVLADLSGEVVANGKPQLFRSVGASVSPSDWFRSALETSSGDEYGFEGMHACSLVSGKRSLVYSCVVREGGRVNGRPLGVLGIVFNWDGLAQAIVEEAPLLAQERLTTRIVIVDPAGRVLASTGPELGETTPGRISIDRIAGFGSGRGVCQVELRGDTHRVAYATSPGYETYRTGWSALVLQPA